MFKNRTIEELFNAFEPRKSLIKNTAKIPVKNDVYLQFIGKYQGMEITPDVQLFGYEEALKENQYLEKEHSEIAARVWMIGRSGQGDEWFLDKDTEEVIYYDHEKGEYAERSGFEDFNISFEAFLQAVFIVKAWEDMMESVNAPNPELAQQYRIALNDVHPEFFNRYPYKSNGW
jgi:hypothetical protein